MKKQSIGEMRDLLLVGQPNCGKSTLFNRLCGAHRRTGNVAGVTVDSASGTFAHGGTRFQLTDLPGLYALAGGSAEECVAADALRTHTGGILFVADASALAASLPFMLEVLALGQPTVVALNMADETARRGVRIDYARLSGFVGVPVLPISARYGIGIPALKEALAGAAPAPVPRADAQTILRAVLHRDDRITASDRADRVFLHPAVGIPASVALFAALLFAVFGPLGGGLHDRFAALTEAVVLRPLTALLNAHTVQPLLVSLVTDGILSGVFGVLAFLPQIALLFLLLAVLEDVGVTARIAFLFDPLLRRFGLSGRAILPVTVGLGCTVPAILSARVEEPSARRRLYYVLPFVSCPARAPVYALLASVFFPRLGGLLSFGLYLLGFLVLLLAAKLLSGGVSRADDVFIMELPPYRLPYPPAVFRCAFDKCRAFVCKAGSVILIASAALWLLEHLGPHGAAATVGDSFLGRLGNAVAPIFAPLGFGHAIGAAALVSGFFAKEGVVSALTVLCGGAETVAAVFTPASALSFLIFTLLYTPCAATVAAICKEAGRKTAAFVCLFDFATAYAIAFVFYRMARLL